MIIETIAKAACLTAAVAIFGASSAKADTVAMNATGVNPGAIVVLSNGQSYTALSGNAGVTISGSASLDAGNVGRIESWWAEPRIETDTGIATVVPGMFFARHQETYPWGNRPRSVNRNFNMVVSAGALEPSAVGMCNTIASGLRHNGMSDAEIFGQDRKASYTVQLNYAVDFNGSGSGNVAHEAQSSRKLDVICKAWTPPQLPGGGTYEAPAGAIDMTVAARPVPQRAGTCRVRLQIAMRGARPGAPVQYQVRQDTGEMSPIFQTTANGRGGFDIDQLFQIKRVSGPEEGWFQVESPQNAFPARRSAYSFECDGEGRRDRGDDTARETPTRIPGTGRR